MGDPTHDEVMRKRPDTQAVQDTRDPPGWPPPLPTEYPPPFSAAVLVCPAADSCVAC